MTQTNSRSHLQAFKVRIRMAVPRRFRSRISRLVDNKEVLYCHPRGKSEFGLGAVPSLMISLRERKATSVRLRTYRDSPINSSQRVPIHDSPARQVVAVRGTVVVVGRRRRRVIFSGGTELQVRLGEDRFGEGAGEEGEAQRRARPQEESRGE